jgi:hypothetical protein
VRERLTKLVDSLLLAGVLALIAVIGSIVAFGGKKVAVPIWTLALIAAVFVACAVAIAVLAVRARRLSPDPSSAEHPHARLLKRLRALNSSLGDDDPQLFVTSATAQQYNILRQAAIPVDSVAVLGVPEVRVDPRDEYTDVRVAQLRLHLDQLIAIVE